MENINEVAGGQPLNPNLEKKMKEARATITRAQQIPEGYIEVTLSTRGKIGAPESFYIRNFSPEDLMNLGLADQQDLPIRLIEVLDSLIWNAEGAEQISVKNFHEKEVIELLLFLYETFYTTIFPNQKWVLIDEDYAFLKELHGGETDAYFQQIRSYENESWKPTFDIDIAHDISFYEVPDDLKIKAQIKRKYGDKEFSATFTLPKFGDFITLKYFMETIWAEQDKRFAALGDTIKFRRDMEDKLAKGENIDIRRIPNVPKAEMDKYKEYENEKTLFAVTASKALYLDEFDGHDVSQFPLEDKIKLAKDPRLDYSTFKMVQDRFNELQFGIKEDITVVDPVINQTVTRKYSFQLTDLLTAIRDTRTSETTISFV